jgi:hypothetical protein
MNLLKLISGIAVSAVLAISIVHDVQAQTPTVTCSPINTSSTDWPNGSFSQGCGQGGAMPTDTGDMLTTLQSLAASPTDAGARVQGFTATTGDTLSITITDSGLPTGSETVSYTVQGGDYFTQIATGLANAISSDTNLTNDSIVAYSNGTEVIINSNSGNTTTYAGSTNAGATETITFNGSFAQLGGTVQNPIATFYLYSTQGDYTNGPIFAQYPELPVAPSFVGDTPFNFFGNVSEPYGWTNIFEQDGFAYMPYVTPNTTAHEMSHWFDWLYAKDGIAPPSGTTLNITGHITVGDTLTVSISNSAFPTGLQTVSYTVQTGNTDGDVATGLAAAINANTTITGAGISAIAENSSVVVDSTSVNSTNFLATTNPGATETIDTDTDNLVTNSKVFLDALAVDWTVLNAEIPCSFYEFGPSYPNSLSGGLFTGLSDSQGNYFCNGTNGLGLSLTGSYQTLTNRQVIEAAFQDIFTTTSELNERREIIAEIFVMAFWNEYIPSPINEYYTSLNYIEGPNAGSPAPHTADYFLIGGDSFPCVSHLVQGLGANGQVPTDFNTVISYVYHNDGTGDYTGYGCDGSVTQYTNGGIGGSPSVTPKR